MSIKYFSRCFNLIFFLSTDLIETVSPNLSQYIIIWEKAMPCGQIRLHVWTDPYIWFLNYTSEQLYWAQCFPNRVSELSSEQMSEWSSLLEQHSQQLQAWRDALDTAVQTLRQVRVRLFCLLYTSFWPQLRYPNISYETLTSNLE